MSLIRKIQPPWLIPLWLALGVASALVVGLAPAEQTLGQGIRWVYIHIAFIWTAMLCMLGVGVLSLLEVLTDRAEWTLWRASLSWVTLAVLALAVITSLIVTQINWGGIFWDEPRMRAVLRAMAIWVVLHFAGFWIPHRRWRGALTAVGVALALIPMRVVPLIIHPQNAVGTSTSPAIRLATVALFGIYLTAAVSAVWAAKHSQTRKT